MKDINFIDLTEELMKKSGYELDMTNPDHISFVTKISPVVKLAFEEGINTFEKTMRTTTYLAYMPKENLYQA